MKARTPKPFFVLHDAERSAHHGDRYKIIRMDIRVDHHTSLATIRAQSSNGHANWYGATIENQIKLEWDTIEKLDRLKSFVRKFPIERLSFPEWVESLEKGGVVRRVYDGRVWTREFGNYLLPKDVPGPEFQRWVSEDPIGQCRRAVCASSEDDAKRQIDALYIKMIADREFGMSGQSEVAAEYASWLQRGKPVRVSQFDKYRPVDDMAEILLTVDEEAANTNAKIAA